MGYSLVNVSHWHVECNVGGEIGLSRADFP